MQTAATTPLLKPVGSWTPRLDCNKLLESEEITPQSICASRHNPCKYNPSSLDCMFWTRWPWGINSLSLELNCGRSLLATQRLCSGDYPGLKPLNSYCNNFPSVRLWFVFCFFSFFALFLCYVTYGVHFEDIGQRQLSTDERRNCIESDSLYFYYYFTSSVSP